jgi:flagellar hook-associated protein 3 FlgL
VTERITSQMTANMVLGDLNNTLNNLQNTTQELSTGYRINKPSDDPYGASQVLQLNGQLSGLDSFNSNVTDGNVWAQTTQGSLTNIDQIVQRVRELTVEAANGSNGPTAIGNMAAEVNQMIDAVKQQANTQYDGQYIFAGTATTTQPYAVGGSDVFQGNAGTINRQIAPGSTLQVNADLSQLLGSGPTASDGKLLDVMRSVVTDMQNANVSALGTDLTNLDTNITTLSTIQATVGSTSTRLNMASSRISDMQDTLTQQLSSVRDVDMAKAAIQYSTEQAAYNAALQAGAKIVQNSLVNFLQ